MSFPANLPNRSFFLKKELRAHEKRGCFVDEMFRRKVFRHELRGGRALAPGGRVSPSAAFLVVCLEGFGIPPTDS